jgi:protein SCO1
MIPILRAFALCLIAAAFLGACQKEQPAAVGGPFQLVDQNGRTVTEKALQGKWTAVFFGYTYCPDVCPMTLQTLGEAQDRLGPKAKDFQVVFITVDPARDTPAAMKSYLTSTAFPKGTIGLTGTPQQIAAVAKAYRTYYARKGEGDDYLMDHLSAVYLMDKRGRFDRILANGLGAEEIARQVSDAMR